MSRYLRSPKEEHNGILAVLVMAAVGVFGAGFLSIFTDFSIPFFGGSWWLAGLGLSAAVVALLRDDDMSAWGWRAFGLLALALGFAVIDELAVIGRGLIVAGALATMVSFYFDYHAHQRRPVGRFASAAIIAFILWLTLASATLDAHLTVLSGGVLMMLWYVVPGLRRMRLGIFEGLARLFRPVAQSDENFEPLDLVEEPSNESDPMSDPVAREICGVIADNIEKWIEPEVTRIISSPVVDTYLMNTPKTIRVEQIERLAGIMGRVLSRAVIVTESPEYGVQIQVNKREGQIEGVFYSDVMERFGELAVNEPYSFVSGVDLMGEPVIVDLMREQDPHTLFAGGTGSGKSAWLINMLVQLLEKNSPQDLQMAIADPKEVTGAAFAALPHLWRPIATETDDMLQLVADVDGEMQERYKKLSGAGEMKARNYNAKADTDGIMSLLILIIDEIADLAQHSEKATRDSFINSVAAIARKGRAANIMLIVGVQRPSAENIGGGTIRSQLTRRVALKLKAPSESEMMLDPGNTAACLLTGQGDAILVEEGRSNRRFKSAYIPESPSDAKRAGRIGEPSLKDHLERIIEKWGRGNKFGDPRSSSAQKAARTVAEAHIDSIDDNRWLILEGLMGIALSQRDPHAIINLTTIQVVAAAVAAAPEGYVPQPAITPALAERAMGEWGWQRRKESGTWIVLAAQIEEHHGAAAMSGEATRRRRDPDGMDDLLDEARSASDGPTRRRR